MYKSIVILCFVLLLSSCVYTTDGSHIAKATEFCKEKGGVVTQLKYRGMFDKFYVRCSTGDTLSWRVKDN